jgi:four helix bundle protein
MFLQLAHTKLDIYEACKQLVVICYSLSARFPNEEKFALSAQIRRAAISVFLNLAEGCAKSSQKERCRFFETSRGSLVEIDTAFLIATELNYIKKEETEALKAIAIRCYQMLSKMIK